ncbi:hypothetical protein Tco_1000729 [Tanacetum coccineum]
MANENVLAPAPTRFDDQILPFNAWVPIGKSNYVLDLQKKQRNLIFQIFVDILQNTNFFRAFTASASVPAIYIQQFWNTLTQEAKTGVYHFQLDEDWFILNASLLREDLDITPIDQAHQFESPPSGDAIMDFVNVLGYPEETHFVYRMVVNNLYQPWRATLLMINQCRTGKTSRFDRPRYLVLQMLWGIITRTNVDYAELMWEEFVQAIQTFLADKANLGIATKKDKEIKPHVILYCRFTKLIICYLGRKHNINQRSGSPFNMAKVDHHLGNLKFVPKGEEDEVFGMQIPKELITNNTRNAPYYNAYLEMSKKPATAKQPKPVSSKQSKPVPAKQPKPVKEKSTKPSPVKKAGKGEEVYYDLQQGIQISLESFQPPVDGVAFREPASSITHKLPIVEGKGKGIAIDEQRRISVTEEASTGPFAQPEDDTSANIVCDTPSPTDAESGAETDKTNIEGDTEILNIGEEQGEDVANKVDLEEKIAEIDEGQAGSDPGKTPESQPPPERILMEEDQAGPNLGQSHVAFAGPDPEPMHDDFISNVYPQVHESLKHLDEEHSPKDEPRNANMETEVESMVIVPIHQASSSVPRLTTLVIDLTPPKLVSSTVQEPVFTATTKTTTITLPPPPPSQQQSTTDPALASRVSALETMFESGSYKSHPEHEALYEALEVSMDRDNQEELHETLTTSPSQSEQPIDDVPILDDVHISNSEDISAAPLLKIKTRPDWLKPIPEEDRPETPEPDWIIPSNDLPKPENNWANAFATSKSKLSKADLEGPTYKVVRAFHSNSISYQFQMEECHMLLTDQIDLVNLDGHRVIPDVSKSLPLGGPPGQVTIQPQFFFNKDLEYLVSGSKERRSALSISKLKAANYPDFGLEELVPSLWIESEREYNISAAHGISHWWFKRKEFYITRHSAPFDRRVVRSHMRILSVVSLKTISRYGYTYLKEIILRRADYNEYKISESAS